MHLELVELLRCPNAHAESVLVAASNKTSARYVMDGLLGCPECGADYGIERGITRFGARRAAQEPEQPAETELSLAEYAMRVAAQLGVTDGRTVYALVNFPARTALEIRAIVPARLMLINAHNTEALGDPSLSLGDAPAGVVQCDDLAPFVNTKFDGVALAGSVNAHLLAQAVTMLKAKGRLVAPASCEVPKGVSELVRDGREWVATRDAIVTAPIGITRR